MRVGGGMYVWNRSRRFIGLRYLNGNSSLQDNSREEEASNQSSMCSYPHLAVRDVTNANQHAVPATSVIWTLGLQSQQYTEGVFLSRDDAVHILHAFVLFLGDTWDNTTSVLVFVMNSQSPLCCPTSKFFEKEPSSSFLASNWSSAEYLLSELQMWYDYGQIPLTISDVIFDTALLRSETSSTIREYPCAICCATDGKTSARMWWNDLGGRKRKKKNG